MSVMSAFRPRLGSLVAAFEGRKIYDLAFHLDEHVTVEPLLREICDAAREAGLARASENGRWHRIVGLKRWDEFVLTGIHDPHARSIYLIRAHLKEAITDWAHDPEGLAVAERPDLGPRLASAVLRTEKITIIGSRHVTALTDLLMSQIESPVPNMKDIPIRDHSSALDGKPVAVRMDGWQPVLTRFGGEGLARLPAVENRASVEHHVLKTGGRVVLFTSEDNPGVSERMYDISVERVGLQNQVGSYGSEMGLLEHRRLFRNMTGGVYAPLGDHFPGVRMVDGVIVATDGTVPDGAAREVVTFGDDVLEDPCVMSGEDFTRVMFGPDADPEDLDRLVAEGEIRAHVMEVTPGDLHVYVPNGWDVEAFSAAAQRSGVLRVEDGDVHMLISGTPLGFAPQDVSEAPPVDATGRPVFGSVLDESPEP